MENIRAHKKEIIPRSKATIYQYNGLANHQNLRLLKRSDMSIDIKIQENTIGLNPLLKLSSSLLNSGAFWEDWYHFLISMINKNKIKFHLVLF